MGLPLAIFILGEFIAQVPRELDEAARVDGASEYRIFWLVLPLVRPAIAAVGVFTMIPIWNDLWFPLILAPGSATATVTLGVQQFLGQFVSDWNAVLAALTLAIPDPGALHRLQPPARARPEFRPCAIVPRRLRPGRCVPAFRSLEMPKQARRGQP